MKKQKGITLIALVITIIVLLILAGVTISMVLGDDSIIKQADTSTVKNQAAAIQEKLDIAVLNNKSTKYNNGEITTKSDLVNELLTGGLITEEEASSLNNGNDILVVGDTSIDFSVLNENLMIEDDTVICNGVEYASLADAIVAINAGQNSGTITLKGNTKISETLPINTNITINGNGYTISRNNSENSTFTDLMFKVESNATLTLENIHADGGAKWTGSVDTTLSRGTENSGIKTEAAIIETVGTGSIILNQGAIVENNDGHNAISLATRGGGTLTLNGGQIINNASGSGAIWGGGHIIVNEGSKINGNYSSGLAGAIRMVGKCNLTMNGGEICNNVAATDGGAIWGYGTNGNSSVYNLSGGKMENNVALGVGGAIYTGTYSTINMSGNFEICNNTASDSGAMRITNYTIFNMTGGKMYGNTSTSNSQYNGFYSWCPQLTITGGELADNITIAGAHTPTVGGNGITGIIHFNVSTNHNTVNLAPEFGTIKFTVAEEENFSAFNFKPADGYTYSAGDEEKLICMNEGYTVVWDTNSNTFKLQ